MMKPKARANNRLLVLCTSINDVTAWPFWKFLQMKKIRGVTDMALLAFNSEGGSFEARIDGDKYTMKNYAKVKGYKQDMMENFLSRWYDPGRSYFVYGGHGMGDYLELEQNKLALQVHELASLLDKRWFEAILFDACFMANLDCAYHLRNNTRYIGACEGYMWEPDTALDHHIFNTHNASVMSRYKDPRHILETIQKDYVAKAPRGDFSVLDTTHSAALRQFVQDHVVQRVYNRAMFYTPVQQERVSRLAQVAITASSKEFGEPGGESYVKDLELRRLQSAPTSPDAFLLANAGRLGSKQKILQAIQFEHALYPSEAFDKHLLDLRSYLVDMAVEEEVLRERGPPVRRSSRGPRLAAAGAWTPSRAAIVDKHGAYPVESPIVPQSPTILSPPQANGIIADSNSCPSVFPPNSAHYGLDLFQKVVLSHAAPRSAGIYASRLNGLSLTVHEYSTMSKPLEPWKVSRTMLHKRAKTFLKRGSLEEVRLRPSYQAQATIIPAADQQQQLPVDVSVVAPSLSTSEDSSPLNLSSRSSSSSLQYADEWQPRSARAVSPLPML